MIKYLNMENASLEITFKTFKEYYIFLKSNYLDIVKLNIKRITLKIKEKDLKKTINFINDLKEIEDILLILQVKLSYFPGIIIPNNVVIFNTNSKKEIINDQIFQVLNLHKNNIYLISNLINKDVNVIVNPVINMRSIIKFMNTLESLFAIVNNKDVNLGGYFVPSSLMREHPCNAYLCDGWKCHKSISTLPKVISIESDYNVYPHGLINSKLIIGNVKNNSLKSILTKYLKSDNHHKFQEYCKNVFIKYLANYPYELMPIIEYVKLEMSNDE